MYKNILVPVALDHEHDTAEAMRVAQSLRSDGGKITLLSVVESIPGYVASYLPKGQQEKNRAEIETNLKADASDAEGVESKVITGHAGGSIVDYAKDHGADLIIIASHKPGLQDFFLGSTAARVVRYSQCAVHVLR
ncbi:universal stress protein [Profundibacter sp.]